MKRIRFFNAFDPVSPFFRGLLPYLASRDFQIEIVISQADYRPGSQLDKLLQQHQNIRAIRTWSMAQIPNASFRKALIMVVYLIQAALYSLLGPSVDLNVFLPQPPLFVAWGRLLKILRRQPYCYIEMDIFPEYLVELLGWPRRSVMVQIAFGVYRFGLRAARDIVVIGRCMAARLEHLGATKAQLTFLPNWADEKTIIPIPHQENQFRLVQGWQDKFVILYAGNIGLPQYFDDLLRVAKGLQDQDDLLFVFLGDGVRKAWLKKQIAALALRNVQVLPFMHSQFALAEILSAGDVHFISLRSQLTGVAVPSKSYGVFSAGRPIVYQGGLQGEVAQVLVEQQVGTVVPIKDELQLRQAILFYYHHPEVCQAQGRRARLLAEVRYSQDRIMQEYEELFVCR